MVDILQKEINCKYCEDKRTIHIISSEFGNVEIPCPHCCIVYGGRSMWKSWTIKMLTMYELAHSKSDDNGDSIIRKS